MAESDHVSTLVWEEMAEASRAFREAHSIDPVHEWRARNGPFAGSACGHTCVPSCTLVPVCKDTFGCATTGTIHDCGLDKCKESLLVREGHFVCRLTGYELGRVYVHAWSARIESDIATCGDTVNATSSIQYKKKRRSSVRSRKASAREIVAAVVKQVLQNPNETELTRKRWTLVTCAIKRATMVYAADCAAAGVLPNMTEVEDIAQRKLMRARLWQRERCKEDRLQFYVDVICNLWSTVAQIMTQNRTETHIKTFALGCLYKIQHGFDVHGNRILPEDEWLSWNLPLACDIVAYGFPKRFVTVGRNTLLDAFKHLVQTNRLKCTDLDVTHGCKQN